MPSPTAPTTAGSAAQKQQHSSAGFRIEKVDDLTEKLAQMGSLQSESVTPSELMASERSATNSRKARFRPARKRPATNREAGGITQDQINDLIERRKSEISPLPAEASDEEVAAHNAMVEEANNRPGRFIPILDNGLPTSKSFWIWDDELSKMGRKAKTTTPKKLKSKPLTLTGYYWVTSGKGWALKGSKRDANGNNPYLGYLSAERYREMKSQFKGDDLKAVLRQWIEETVAAKNSN